MQKFTHQPFKEYYENLTNWLITLRRGESVIRCSIYNIYYSPCQSIHFLPGCTCACLCWLLDLTYITHPVRVFIFSYDVRVHAFVGFQIVFLDVSAVDVWLVIFITYITHHVRVFIFSQDVCMHAFVGFQIVSLDVSEVALPNQASVIKCHG